MRLFIFLFFCLILANSALAYHKVVDGDSLEVDGKRVRLQGIDAPEYKQMCFDKDQKSYDCGAKATEELKKIIGKNPLKCNFLGHDTYKRKLAICYVNDLNINKKMVEDGWALSYDFKTEGFPDEENQARLGKKGLWQGKFMRPEIYRRLKPK